jgi:hypothetical protein
LVPYRINEIILYYIYMSQSWKKHGGIKNLDSLNHLNVNSITTDDLNIRKPYKGTFSVSGEFYGFDNAEIYKKLTVRDDICAQKNVNVYEKLIIGRSDITDVKTHFFASDSSGIGLNIESPNATLDISGEHSNILNVYSGSSHTHNVLAQNKDHQKISFEIDPSMSQIHFDRLDNSFNLMYDGHQVQFDERIVIGERKTEIGPSLLVADNGFKKEPFLQNVFGELSYRCEPVEISSEDTSTNSMLLFSNGSKNNWYIGGGGHTSDSNHQIGFSGYKNDISFQDPFIVSQIEQSGTGNEIRATTGINKLCPTIDSYALDVNGPIQIKHHELRETLVHNISHGFNTSFSQNYGYAAGSSYTYDSSTNTSFNYIYTTNNYGNTWNQIDVSFQVPNIVTATTLRLHAYDVSNIIAVSFQNKKIYVHTGSYGAPFTFTTVDAPDIPENFEATILQPEYVLTTSDNPPQNIFILNPLDISCNTLFYLTIGESITFSKKLFSNNESIQITDITHDDSYIYFTDTNNNIQVFSNTQLNLNDGNIGNSIDISGYQYNFIKHLNIHSNNYLFACGENIVSIYDADVANNWTDISFQNVSFNYATIYDLSHGLIVGNNGTMYYNRHNIKDQQHWKLVDDSMINGMGNSSLLNANTNTILYVQYNDISGHFSFVVDPANSLPKTFVSYFPTIWYPENAPALMHIEGHLDSHQQNLRLFDNADISNIHFGTHSTIHMNETYHNRIFLQNSEKHISISGEDFVFNGNMIVKGTVQQTAVNDEITTNISFTNQQGIGTDLYGTDQKKIYVNYKNIISNTVDELKNSGFYIYKDIQQSNDVSPVRQDGFIKVSGEDPSRISIRSVANPNVVSLDLANLITPPTNQNSLLVLKRLTGNTDYNDTSDNYVITSTQNEKQVIDLTGIQLINVENIEVNTLAAVNQISEGSTSLGTDATAINITITNSINDLQIGFTNLSTTNNIDVSSGNTLLGRNALQQMTDNTQNNTAMGFQTLAATTSGNSNTAFGSQSLSAVTTNINNTAIGFQSGNTSTGNNNTFLGANTDISATVHPDDSTAIGYGARITKSNQIVVGTNNQIVEIPGQLLIHTDVSFQSTLDVSDTVHFHKNLIVDTDVSFGNKLHFTDINNSKILFANTGTISNDTDSGIDKLIIGLTQEDRIVLDSSGVNYFDASNNHLFRKTNGDELLQIDCSNDFIRSNVPLRIGVSSGLTSENQKMALQFNNDLSSGIFYNSEGDYTLRSKGHNILRLSRLNQNTSLGFLSTSAHTNYGYTGNTSMGFQSFGYSSGNYNTNIGDAASVVLIGENNTNMGHRAGAYIIGDNNVCIGSNAFGSGNNFTHRHIVSNNTAIGSNSLFYTLSGDLNTAIGYKSGMDLDDGSYNTFLGANTNIDNSANIYSYSTAIGYGAIIDTSNQIVIGTSNEYIYIPGGDLRFTDHSYNDTIKHDVSGTVRTLQATIQNEKRIALDTSGTNIYDASFHEFRNIGGTETRFSIHPDTIVLGHDSKIDQITFSQQKKYIIQPSTIHADISFDITKNATFGNNIVSSYDGKIIAVAFPKDSVDSDTSTSSKGAIIIYEMDISGQFQDKYSFSEVDMTDITANNFGHTMSMNKSGNKLVVGSDVNAGHGYIRRFQRNSNGSWYNISGGIYEDVYSGVIEGSKITDVSGGDKFGYSVCLNDTGSIFAVNSAKSFHFFTWDLDVYRLVQQPAIVDTEKNFFISNAGDFIFTSVFVEVEVEGITYDFSGGRLFFIKVDETLSEEYRAIYDISGDYDGIDSDKFGYKKDSIASILTEDDDLYVVTKSKDKLIYLKGKGADINTNNIDLDAPPDPIALDTIAELDISDNTLSLQMDSTGNIFSYVHAPTTGNHTTYIYRYDGSFNEMKTITGSNYEMELSISILHSAMSGNGRTLYNIHHPGGSNTTKLTSAYINLDYKVESSYLMTSSYNTALGADSLCDLRGTWYSGDHNSALGVQAGKKLQYGSRNTFLGANTDVDISNGVYENSTAIGYGAIIEESNQIVLGTASESVKIPGKLNFESVPLDTTINRIDLYGNTYGFGMNGNTLAYYVPGTAHHKFVVGGNEVARFDISGLGIGTTSPDYPLHIQSDTLPQLFIQGAINSDVVIRSGSGPDYTNNFHQIRFKHYASSVGNEHNNSIKFEVNGGTESTPTTRMTILGNGNVGIGTTSPSAPLHIYKDDDTDNNLIEMLRLQRHCNDINSVADAEGGYIGLHVTDDNFGGELARISWRADNASPNNHEGDGRLSFWTAKADGTQSTRNDFTLSERMTITRDGYVGIGTTSPGFTLDVSGNMGVNNVIHGPNDNHLILQLRKDDKAILLQDNSGVAGIEMYGSSSSSNVYNADTHTFRSRAGTTTLAIMSTFGSNTSFGKGANKNHAVGNNANTCFGTSAGANIFNDSSNNQGNANTAFGCQALMTAGNCYYNVAVGSNALIYAATGSVNTAVGANAGLNISTGCGNTGVGSGVLQGVTSGTWNCAIGAYAGYKDSLANIKAITTGTYNTFLGSFTTSDVSDCDHSTAVGFGARITKSDQIVLGRTYEAPDVYIPGNVGIGTTSPSEALEIRKDVTIGSSNTQHLQGQLSIGNASLSQGYVGMTYKARGANPQDIVYAATYWNPNHPSGNYGTNGYFGIAVTDYASSGSDTYGVTEGELESQTHLAITHEGYVGIGTTSPARSLDVIGEIKASTNLICGADIQIDGVLVFPNADGDKITFFSGVGISLISLLLKYKVNSNVRHGFFVENYEVAKFSKYGAEFGTQITSVIIGNQVGYNNGTQLNPTNSVIIGRHAGYATSSTDNVAVGMNALANSTKSGAGDNVAIGKSALTSATQDGNVAIGAYAGASITGYSTMGRSNVLIGYSSGYQNDSGQTTGNNLITGRYNTLIGPYTHTTKSDCQYSTAIGYNARITKNHQIVLGKTSSTLPDVYIPGKLGIGEDNPTEKLHVVGNAKITGTLNVSGNAFFNQIFGTDIATVATENKYQLLIYDDVGARMHIYGQNHTVYSGGHAYYDSGSHFFRGLSASSATSTVYIQGTGQATSTSTGALRVSGGVGIAMNLHVGGEANATSFNASSDYRLKENVQTISGDIYTIDNLRPVSYYLKDSQEPHIGFIAHELQEHVPTAVKGEKDGEIMQSVNYSELIPILVKEIQDLKKEVRQLKERIQVREPY